eukprot:scaffold8603_cov109-Isochrysis_galbana.AAC.3
MRVDKAGTTPIAYANGVAAHTEAQWGEKTRARRVSSGQGRQAEGQAGAPWTRAWRADAPGPFCLLRCLQAYPGDNPGGVGVGGMVGPQD